MASLVRVHRPSTNQQVEDISDDDSENGNDSNESNGGDYDGDDSEHDDYRDDSEDDCYNQHRGNSGRNGRKELTQALKVSQPIPMPPLFSRLAGVEVIIFHEKFM